MDQNKWKETLEELWGQTCKAAMEAGDAAKTGVKKAEKAAEDTVQYAKLKLEESDLETRVRRCLQRVGEMVYATHTGDPTDSGDMEEVLREIDRLKEELRRRERQRMILRGRMPCAGCGAMNEKGSVYCTNCGQPLERQAEK